MLGYLIIVYILSGETKTVLGVGWGGMGVFVVGIGYNSEKREIWKDIIFGLPASPFLFYFVSFLFLDFVLLYFLCWGSFLSLFIILLGMEI